MYGMSKKMATIKEAISFASGNRDTGEIRWFLGQRSHGYVESSRLHCEVYADYPEFEIIASKAVGRGRPEIIVQNRHDK